MTTKTNALALQDRIANARKLIADRAHLLRNVYGAEPIKESRQQDAELFNLVALDAVLQGEE